METPTTIPPCKVTNSSQTIFPFNYFQTYSSFTLLQYCASHVCIATTIFKCHYRAAVFAQMISRLSSCVSCNSELKILQIYPTSLTFFSVKNWVTAQTVFLVSQKASMYKWANKLVTQCLGCRYYSVYDSGDRQPLLDAYHDGASFSLTTPYSTQNPSRWENMHFSNNCHHCFTWVFKGFLLAECKVEVKQAKGEQTSGQFRELKWAIFPCALLCSCCSWNLHVLFLQYRSSLGEYHKDSRNLKRLKDSSESNF